MNKRTLPRPQLLFVAAFLLTTLSACNKGYGCPSNFSIEDALTTLVKALLPLF